jgi:MFS family permease
MVSGRRFSPINIIIITVLVDMTGFGMIIPLIPFYARRFYAGGTGIGILIASFSFMQFIFSPILGRISDNRGRRPVLLFSILTSIASFILFTIANNFFILLASRIIAGLATEGGVAQAYIADITSRDERSSGIGKVGAASGLGFILGPVISGLLSPYGLWAPGAAAALLGFINLLFVFLFLPEPDVLKASGMSKGWIDSLQDVWVILKEPLKGQVIIIYFIVTLAFAAIPVIIPLLAIEYYGFTEVETSYMFIFVGLIQVSLQGFAMRRLVEKFSEEKLIILGPLFMILGIFFMPLIENIIFFGICLSLLSIGIGTSNTAVPSFISLMTADEKQGSTLGVTQSIGSIARIPGPLIGGITTDFGGIASPFYLSGAMLILPFILGCRVFRFCTMKGLFNSSSEEE